MLWLYVQAPFAAFRTFTAGWYRPTTAFITPSAAYGLLMNVAGIETRRDDGISAMTVTQFELPPARIALGAVAVNPRGPASSDSGHDASPSVDGAFPSVQTLYQQLHNYPVGASGKERKGDTKGNKYNITPVRRELLADVRACIGFEGSADVEDRIREGLSGAYSRYGLPFLGDNAFLIDRLEIIERPLAAHWYRRVGSDHEGVIRPQTTRLTIWIDRQDMSKTESALYAPDSDARTEVPSDSYWTQIQPPSRPPEVPKKSRGA